LNSPAVLFIVGLKKRPKGFLSEGILRIGKKRGEKSPLFLEREGGLGDEFE
jgi:hypothetical protein